MCGMCVVTLVLVGKVRVTNILAHAAGRIFNSGMAPEFAQPSQAATTTSTTTSSTLTGTTPASSGAPQLSPRDKKRADVKVRRPL